MELLVMVVIMLLLLLRKPILIRTGVTCVAVVSSDVGRGCFAVHVHHRVNMVVIMIMIVIIMHIAHRIIICISVISVINHIVVNNISVRSMTTTAVGVVGMDVATAAAVVVVAPSTL